MFFQKNRMRDLRRIRFLTSLNEKSSELVRNDISKLIFQNTHIGNFNKAFRSEMPFVFYTRFSNIRIKIIFVPLSLYGYI